MQQELILTPSPMFQNKSVLLYHLHGGMVSFDGWTHKGYIMGKAQVPPKHKIIISRNLYYPLDHLHFYLNSKVVLGYINNKTRQFYVYVENRVQCIKKSTLPEQWKHVPSQINFADLVFRPLLAHNLKDVPLTAFCTAKCPWQSRPSY